MASRDNGVPWGNLWRWVVSTMLFVLLIGLPPAVVTEFDTEHNSTFVAIVLFISAIVAAYVVWSEDIPWPGDPE